jgi:transaldolase
MFRDRFSSPRWEKLAALGAHPQLPLWASTSTKNPDYPDTRYVDSLIGTDTINTMAESTITAFEDHGTVARTIDTVIGEATGVMANLHPVGIDMDEIGRSLEDQGVDGFHQSFADLLITLRDKARQLA